jgi:hypothetical protein
MDTINLDDNQKEYVNLCHDPVGIKRMMGGYLNGYVSGMGGATLVVACDLLMEAWEGHHLVEAWEQHHFVVAWELRWVVARFPPC